MFLSGGDDQMDSGPRREAADHDLKQLILLAIAAHLHDHGPRNWDQLREHPAYAHIIGRAAGEKGRRKFWRWVKSVPDGRQAVVHLEEIYDSDPFARCDELMEAYGVRVCVVEQLPNFNDAMRFANRHVGRVFLCNGYGDLADDVVRWGDAPRLDASDRRTDEEERTRYTVRIDQYKAMSLSLSRLVDTLCLFPDPQELVQEIRVKESRQLLAICKDVAFVHFQKTALVTERINEGERKLRRKVVKVGIDPHASYANMLCDVAWTRAHGTGTFILPNVEQVRPDVPGSAVDLYQSRTSSGVPPVVAGWMTEIDEALAVTCGGCSHFPFGDEAPPAFGECPVQKARVRARDPGCYAHDPIGSS